MSLVVSKKTKMSDLVNFRLRIATVDSRSFVGQLLAFDKHMNLVLADCEEQRAPKKDSSEVLKRNLGLLILRGEQIVSVVIEGGPVTDNKTRIGVDKGKGVSRPLKTPISVKSKVKGFKRQ